MKKFGDFICKNKILVIMIFLLLLIPTVIGINSTKINYDILVYLPDDIETMKGQNILTEDFEMGSYAVITTENVESKDILAFEEKVKNINGVAKVVSAVDIVGTTIPMEFLPSEIRDKISVDGSSLMMVTFKDTISSDETLAAVREIRTLAKDNFKIGGMSSMVLDTMELSEKEVTVYIVIAVICCLIVLMLSLDSYIVPVLLLLNIGIAILLNMGTNIIFGNISYITKAISAVLQLGVTMDFSIFLYHKYNHFKEKSKNNNEAMRNAICDTIVSVFGSSLTTIAGFLALCAMTLTLGKDIGLVMAKGVIFGVICVITLFPALLLTCDKLIEKTKHRELLPKFNFLNNFIIKHHKIIFVIFLVLIIPFWYGNQNTKVYYNLDRSLPSDLASSIANSTLKEKFNIVSPEIILIDSNLKNNTINEMLEEIKSIEGVDFVLSSSSLSELGIPIEALDKELVSTFENEQYKLILLNSVYSTATDELNEQIDIIDKIVKKYDSNAIVAGEGPLMKDMVEITDIDLKNVSIWSIALVFVIMVFVLKSITLPVLLVLAIEFAIFVNMGIPYYTGTVIPFISSIVIGTIQLGATIDYAILMTTKYLEERKIGKSSEESIKVSLQSSTSSIIVSGLCLFAATIGVGVYSKLEMISSICNLIARGAIVSMIVVIFVIPSLLLIFDKIICKTTMGFGKEEKMKKNSKKITSVLLIGSIVFYNILVADATVKNETVYAKLSQDGTTNKILVNEHIYTDDKTATDLTNLKNILNINGDETYTIDGNKITWSGNDIYYRGTSEEELPIKVTTIYKLDGKEIEKKDLIGKSGKVEIILNITNNSKKNVVVNGKNETMYTPFVVVSGLIIPTKDNTNITVNSGKVVNNGTNNMILAISSPGLSESLGLKELESLNNVVISYETKSFKDSSIYMVATPKIIDSSDLAVFNKLDSLYSSINTLASSSQKLTSGSKTLSENLSLYNSKMTELTYNLNLLGSGTKKLAEGYSSINDGINTLADRVSSLETLLSGLEKVSQGLNSVSTSLDTLSQNSDNMTKMLNDTNAQIVTHIETLKTIADTTSDEETKRKLEEEIARLEATLQNSGLNMTVENITNLNEGISTINKQLQLITDNTSSLGSSLGTLSSSINALKEGSNIFNENLNSLNSNFALLQNGADTLGEKTAQLVEGAEALYQGMNEFDSKGIKTLSNYTYSIKTFEQKAKKLVELGEDYQTFTMKDENTKGETKFVMIIE